MSPDRSKEVIDAVELVGSCVMLAAFLALAIWG